MLCSSTPAVFRRPQLAHHQIQGGNQLHAPTVVSEGLAGSHAARFVAVSEATFHQFATPFQQALAATGFSMRWMLTFAAPEMRPGLMHRPLEYCHPGLDSSSSISRCRPCPRRLQSHLHPHARVQMNSARPCDPDAYDHRRCRLRRRGPSSSVHSLAREVLSYCARKYK